jgi:hypothetical protein
MITPASSPSSTTAPPESPLQLVTSPSRRRVSNSLRPHRVDGRRTGATGAVVGREGGGHAVPDERHDAVLDSAVHGRASWREGGDGSVAVEDDRDDVVALAPVTLRERAVEDRHAGPGLDLAPGADREPDGGRRPRRQAVLDRHDDARGDRRARALRRSDAHEAHGRVVLVGRRVHEPTRSRLDPWVRQTARGAGGEGERGEGAHVFGGSRRRACPFAEETGAIL